MPEKNPETYSFLTYLWVLGLSGWGGFVSFMRKRRQGVARPFNFAEFLGDIAASALAGVITFYLCEAAGTPQLMSASLVAISGHMGGRALFMFERWMERRYPLPDEKTEDVLR